jgi:phosphopantothenoylcysteine decarboxylase/phosphopantothenate--cysteine ligase
MLSLTNKRILLGITGGIAAYKSAELTRTLVKAGAEVRIAMTPAATEFITPLTMQALSGNRVHPGSAR